MCVLMYVRTHARMCAHAHTCDGGQGSAAALHRSETGLDISHTRSHFLHCFRVGRIKGLELLQRLAVLPHPYTLVEARRAT